MCAGDGEFAPVAVGEGTRCHAVALGIGIHVPCAVGDIHAAHHLSAVDRLNGLAVVGREGHAVVAAAAVAMTHAGAELVGVGGIGGRGLVGDGKSRP